MGCGRAAGEGRMTAPSREFRRRKLAEQDGAGLQQLRNRGCFKARKVVRPRTRVAGRAHPGASADVFEYERDAVHWAAIVARYDLGLRLRACSRA
jgi:hypothetical protein